MTQDRLSEFTLFLEANLANSTILGSTGFNLDFPEFDLMPFDYLDFAESELAIDTTAAKINCVMHLKRAIECEIDTFIYTFNISLSRNNLPNKLDFASKSGLFSPRSITKLNKTRNKLEHEYSIPDHLELENYFDIATGFVHAIEGCIFMLAQHRDMEWGHISDETFNTTWGGEFSKENQQISFWWANDGNKYELTFSNSNSPDDFSLGLGIYILLCRATTLLSAEFVLEKMRKLINTARDNSTHQRRELLGLVDQLPK
ncbi:hypothetical protein D3C72_676250 [compost metagenome]